jgi:ferrous iron transport protein A
MMLNQKIMNNTVAQLPIGKVGKVLAISGDNAITKRLMEMGIVPGVALRVIKTAPFGCPMEIRVRGYNLAIRRSEAQSIEILIPETQVIS